ncbi:MAG: acetyl-CoA carboxylase biotin carboxyl carrier protein [Acholeplasmataceae bacterium]|jgi:acetyl-CoA carboxylase biotin carboxyl carrier protein|nr:acetyl-CoA carboxylase biotin carboxyl carrier protein [Acholeplasmataceae bacterium]
MTIKEIQNIIKDFESSTLMTLELEMEGFKLRLSKNKNDDIAQVNQSKESNSNQIQTTQKPIELNQKTLIKSPLVGTFYASATPNGKPFVEVGSPVKKGQVVCIIEAMKIMNEITSPYDGYVKEILVKNGEVIGFNQALIRVGEANEK